MPGSQIPKRIHVRMLQSLQTTHKPLVPLQVPWGMVTGPDGNLYIAMDDEFEVVQDIPPN